MKEKQDDGLPSKATCIGYTLLHCGHSSEEAEGIIERMREQKRKSDAIFERIHAESMGLPEALCDKLYPKTWE